MMSYNVEHCSDSLTQPRLSKLNFYSMSAAYLTLNTYRRFYEALAFVIFPNRFIDEVGCAVIVVSSVHCTKWNE